VKCVQLYDFEVRIFLWDTAGQEKYHALAPMYAQFAAVAVVVTDIANPHSFETVDKWIDLSKQENDRALAVILTINKIDLRTDQNLQPEQIGEKFGSKFAEICYVSAATDTEVENLFQLVAKLGYEFVTGVTDENASAASLLQPTPVEKKCC
jgi:small GTP-binding protein